MKSVRVMFLRNHEGIAAGESRIFKSDVALSLIALGVAEEVREVKPAGPSEIKPAWPSETKDESFGGKKKAKTRRS